MPKVILAEKDLTSAEAAQYDDYIVLIPGKKALLVKKADGTEVEIGGNESGALKEYYFTKASDLKEALEEGETGDLSLKMAYRLLELGMTVLYRWIESDSNLDDEYFWKPYQDKGTYNLRFLTCGGYASQESAQYAIECAAKRGDAIALIDIPTGDTTISLPLVNVITGGVLKLNGTNTEFDNSSLTLTAYYSNGSYETTENKSGVATYTYENAEGDPVEHPASEPGTYNIFIKGHYTDDDNVDWVSDSYAQSYTIPAPESGD